MYDEVNPPPPPHVHTQSHTHTHQHSPTRGGRALDNQLCTKTITPADFGEKEAWIDL